MYFNLYTQTQKLYLIFENLWLYHYLWVCRILSYIIHLTPKQEWISNMVFALLTHISMCKIFQVEGTKRNVRTTCNLSGLFTGSRYLGLNPYLNGPIRAVKAAHPTPHLMLDVTGWWPWAQQGHSMTDQWLGKEFPWMLLNTVTCWFMNPHTHVTLSHSFNHINLLHLSKGRKKLEPLIIHK